MHNKKGTTVADSNVNFYLVKVLMEISYNITKTKEYIDYYSCTTRVYLQIGNFSNLKGKRTYY